MSKEKLYVVKNDKGYYWDFEHSGFWEQEIFGYLTTPSRKQAGLVAFEKGSNVVALIEEPKKVVLTKEQAEIVEMLMIKDIRQHIFLTKLMILTPRKGFLFMLTSTATPWQRIRNITSRCHIPRMFGITKLETQNY